MNATKRTLSDLKANFDGSQKRTLANQKTNFGSGATVFYNILFM